MPRFFICPGAQKAGTTTLYNLLRQHPSFHLSRPKETKYFLRDITVVREADYVTNFFAPNICADKIYGEIDPAYLYNFQVPFKIRQALGADVKFIFLLRNPIDRAYSHYWMSRRRGFETETFEKAFELEEARIQALGKHAEWHFTYFSRGLYARQIKRYLDVFPDSQCHFVRFESFVSDQQVEFGRILRFLDVDAADASISFSEKSNEGGMPRSEFLAKLHGQPMAFKTFLKPLIPYRKVRWKAYELIEKINVSRVKPKPISEEFRAVLRAYYKDDVDQLREISRLNLDPWMI